MWHAQMEGTTSHQSLLELVLFIRSPMLREKSRGACPTGLGVFFLIQPFVPLMMPLDEIKV
jgi:hypothetical protein